MTTRSEIEQFLNDFKIKLNVFDVVFINREKNFKTLIELEITTVNRAEILKELKVEDYYKGPTVDYDNGPPLWEFGKKLKQKDVYIKITMGQPNRPVICISFHIAERSIKHPFK